MGSRRAYQIPLAVFSAAPPIQSIRAVFLFPETPSMASWSGGRENQAEVGTPQAPKPSDRRARVAGRDERHSAVHEAAGWPE
ncbi:hypothetical protein F4775DRAFT_535130 [Biscogniauxia sp. FL1348]|nr:hypothetical protein F4775DRAFT_535130 [Biscogniauxia sp. FL1348]